VSTLRPFAALVLVAACALAGVAPVESGASAAAPRERYAPLHRPGPELTVPGKRLREALDCHGDLRNSAKAPVLLNPATGVTPVKNYAWNYERAFTHQHRPWCAVTMPHRTLGDIQTAAEYLVHAIRRMHARSGQRIAILGHSQGGMSMRWALRFWPDTRRMVGDVIGMAGSNHGTTTLRHCVAGRTTCPPAVWQQDRGARFIEALNSRVETFAGISYTEIYTRTDEVVQPSDADATASSALHTGKGRITNVATQDVCPSDVDEHLMVGTVDPVTYALVMDALTHRGPARPERVGPAVCSRVYQPGVDPARAQMYLDILGAAPGLLAVNVPEVNVVGAPEVAREPRLRCYVFAAGC
jgi:hypothetical protein